MADILKEMIQIIPFIQEYPDWLQKGVFVWIMLTAFLLALLVVTPKNVVPKTPDQKKAFWPENTGDNVIDHTHKELNKLEAHPPFSETDLLIALRHLFVSSTIYVDINGERSP